MNGQKQEVLTAMRKLAEAMQELSEAWENVTDEVNEILVQEYPFNMCLKDLQAEVRHWNNEVSEKLKNL